MRLAALGATVVAVTAALGVARPGASAPPAWRLADGPIVPWTHETDLAARTVDPAQAAAASRSAWSLLGTEFSPAIDDGPSLSSSQSWWDEYRGAEIEHDQSRARAALAAPGQRPARPLLRLLAHWIDRLFHPLRPGDRAPECGPAYAVQFADPERALPPGYDADDHGLPSSPFPQPLERDSILAPPPEPMPTPPNPEIPKPSASELPAPAIPGEPALPVAPEAAPDLPYTAPPPAIAPPALLVPPNSLPQLPGLQPARPDFVPPMPMPSIEEPAPIQTEPRQLAPPANVLPLEQNSRNVPPAATNQPPPRRLGEEYPPVVELVPEPVLPDLPSTVSPPPAEPAEPVLPQNTIPRAPRLPKNAIPRSSR